jgi:hypothetical protein
MKAGSTAATTKNHRLGQRSGRHPEPGSYGGDSWTALSLQGDALGALFALAGAGASLGDLVEKLANESGSRPDRSGILRLCW